MASGKFNNLTATNMLPISYDKELEFVAQCYASACKFSEDDCRETSRFSSVGQNIGYLAKARVAYLPDHLEDMLKQWMKRGQNISRNMLSEFDASEKRYFYYLSAKYFENPVFFIAITNYLLK